jgi:predicted RNA binding protein with dsRBD fold (UPF0201 family)
VLRVRVETPCRPTETVEKVTAALRALFPEIKVSVEEGRIVGTAASLDRLREQIRHQKIRDTARRQLLAGRHGDRTTVSLSKQAAFMGVVNFGASSPLGDLLVEIESDELDAVIDYVAESTVKSRP